MPFIHDGFLLHGAAARRLYDARFAGWRATRSRWR